MDACQGINIFSIEVGRPECLLGASIDEEMGGPFYLINMVKFTALLATFGLLLIAQRACACRQTCGALGWSRSHVLQRHHQRLLAGERWLRVCACRR